MKIKLKSRVHLKKRIYIQSQEWDT